MGGAPEARPEGGGAAAAEGAGVPPEELIKRLESMLEFTARDSDDGVVVKWMGEERRYSDLDEFWQEYTERIDGLLESSGWEPLWELIYENRYFNAPCAPREYLYMDTAVVLARRVEGDRELLLIANFREGYACDTAWFRDQVYVYERERPVITPEKTPFTSRVVEIFYDEFGEPRAVWASAIADFIEELAEAELSGRLAEKLREVKARLSAGAWVYEYGKLLAAIEKAASEVGVAVGGEEG